MNPRSPWAVVEDVAAARRARARDEIVRLVHRTGGVRRLARDVTRVLERAVPFDGVSVATVDPATVLPTGRVVTNGVDLEMLSRLVEIELRERARAGTPDRRHLRSHRP
jgi:hypothetical protein